jgi:hypothetical protein
MKNNQVGNDFSTFSPPLSPKNHPLSPIKMRHPSQKNTETAEESSSLYGGSALN